MFIILCLMVNGCFGLLQSNATIYIDPDTGFESRSWFYSPSQTIEETKIKLTQRILKSTLYKKCVERGDTPKATYSEPIFSSFTLPVMNSLTLTCWPK